MKQITEDYVSFEIAVLLKEKEFDKEPTRYYRIKDEIIVSSRFIKDTEGLRKAKDFEQKYTQAPSLSLVLKWLREVHRIETNITLSELNSDNSRKYMFDIYSSDTNRDFDSIQMYGFDSHEEAVEAAILYVLKNLI